MGKISKVMPHSPSPFPPGEGREALRQNVQMSKIFWLKYGTVLPYTFVPKFTSKIFQLHFVLWQISSELSKIHSICPHTL